jgi:hypothetical protein
MKQKQYEYKLYSRGWPNHNILESEQSHHNTLRYAKNLFYHNAKVGVGEHVYEYPWENNQKIMKTRGSDTFIIKRRKKQI